MKPRLYFAYGSNLSHSQMKRRCPDSRLYETPLAYLSEYRWVISPRGYANVVESSNDQSVVWGMLYEISASDEARLDRFEGVPVSYGKVEMDVFGFGSSSKELQREKLRALVYVDPRPGESLPLSEYIGRMNAGIADALALGMDPTWIDSNIRNFIPE